MVLAENKCVYLYSSLAKALKLSRGVNYIKRLGLIENEDYKKVTRASDSTVFNSLVEKGLIGSSSVHCILIFDSGLFKCLLRCNKQPAVNFQSFISNCMINNVIEPEVEVKSLINSLTRVT